MKTHLGLLAAVGAFILWGLLPLYWKLLGQIPAYEILCHRMSWSLLLTFGLVMLMGRRQVFFAALRDRRNLKVYTVTALLLAVNWLLYIWAVNSGFIIEASLGYFITPLINVLFGMIFFKEKMHPVQWLAIVMALCGVLYLTFYYGKFPWIALTLAVSFATYGLLHKKNSMAALDGLCLETGVLFLPATLFLLSLEFTGKGAFTTAEPSLALLLASTGLITTAPLLLFGFAAKRIALSTLGFLQYLAPSINLLIGRFIYHEDFPLERLVGFMLIWIALALFLLNTLVRRYRARHQLGVR